MKKRILTSVLSFLMLMTCFSFTASVSTVVAADNVVYVNGEAETNGTGTKDSPFNTLANAVKALQTSGGTVVVTGVTEIPNNAFTNNNAKVTITSFDGTTDYRGSLNAETGLVSGAYLLCKSTSPINFNANYTGEVEFKNLNIVWAFTYTAFNLSGRKLTYGENTRWYEQKTRGTEFYLDAYSETIRLYSITADKELTQSVVSTFNSGAGSAVTKVITGERCKLTTAGHIFNIDGYVKELHISSESNNNTSGKLTVDGDVKINVGSTGTIAKLTVATAGSGNTKGLANKKLLEEITGALSIAINHGGKITTNELSLASADYKINKMFIVNGAENLTVENGTSSGSFVVTTDKTEYNFAVLTDESGTRTLKSLNDGRAEFVLSESGTYNVTLEYIEIPKYTVTFMDHDGTQKGTFTAEEGSVITEFPENPFREGYEFVMWSVDGENPVTTVSGTNITANAVYRKESRKVVFVNGEIAESGNGQTPSSPYKDLAKATNDVAGGGVIVVMGETIIVGKNFANTVPVLVTSVYNGVDYRGELNGDLVLEGAYLLNNTNSPYTNAGANKGLIEFDNINILARAQFNALNMGGHPFAFGKGFAVYEPTTNSTSCETFRNATTFYVRSYDITTSATAEETDILDSFIDGKTKISIYYLGTRGEKTIPGRNIVVNGKLANLYVSNDIKNATQGVLTINGDVKVTVNGTLDNINVAKSSDVSGLGTFKGNLSVIVNPGGTLSSVKDEAKPTNGKYVRINVSEGGTVSHTEKSLEYKIELDKDSAYNYATVSNGEDSFDVLLGGGSGTFRLTSAGEYTITYGTTSIYKVTYTDKVGGSEIDDYYVSETDTEGLTITLPTLSKTSSKKFLGWATNEDATEAEFVGGESVTIDGNTDFYAIWEDIPTFTVTFMTEAGVKISDFTAYEGAKIQLPEAKDHHKYGYTLLGWGEADSDTPVTEVPARNITLYPIYKAKTGADKVVYLNGTKAENGDGASPNTAFNHIQSAIDAVKTSGGTVIVTGITSFRNSTVSPQISPTYNNSGDIIFTSYDKETGIDYRATYNADTQKFTDGAYIYYTNGINLGQNTMTGSVTFENCILAKSKATYLNFDGHPATIGKGVSVYQGTDTFKESSLQMRGIGESGVTKSNPDGLFITLNGLEAGSYSFTVGGAGDATVNGVHLTVDSAIPQSIALGGNNATLTVEGDIIVTVNGDISGLGTDRLNHKSGNFTLILNNNTDVAYPGKIPDGYVLRTVKCEDSFANLTYGNDASEIIVKTEPTMYTHVEVYTGESVLYNVVPLDENYKAVLTLPEGDFTVGFTNDPAYSVSFDTLCDEEIAKQWHESDSEVTVIGGVKNLGYLFEGWEYDGRLYKEGDIFIMPKENIIFTAVWSVAPQITIKLDSNGYGENPESITNYIYEFEKLPILEAENAHFMGWSKDKNADTGVLNIQLLEDTTYYAVWSEEPYVYTLHGRYSDEDSAYIVYVFLEGESQLSGSVTLCANSVLSFKSAIDSLGVKTEVTTNTSDNTSVNITWNAEEEEYRMSDKRLLFTAVYSADKDAVSRLLPEDKVYAEDGKANTEKSDITAYGTISGIVTLDSRNAGDSATTGAVVYAVDADGDIVSSQIIENIGSSNHYSEIEMTLPEGEYTLKIVKSGYIQREIPVNVSEGEFTISDSPMFGGDIVDNSGLGDGIIDIDDFIRVLRGFSEEFRANPQNAKAVDINEDGVINVIDLSIIKTKFSGYVSASPVIVCTDELLSEAAQKTAELISDKFSSSSKVGEAEENCIILTLDTSLKIRDWEITRTGTRIEIKGGSVEAVLHAAENLVIVAVKSGANISVPSNLAYSFPYTFDEVTFDGNSLSEYSFVLPENDEIAENVYSIIKDYLEENYGYTLEVKYTSDDAAPEILVGAMSDISEELDDENCEIKVDGTKLHIAYKGEYAPEIAAYNFIEQVVSSYNEDYDGESGMLEIADGYRHIDADNVSSKFLLMSDTHIESDFLENGRDVYTGWKPDFQALTETYSYINNNFPELTFGLLCGDQLNTGYAYQPEFLNAERDNYFRTLDSLDLHKNSKTEDNLTEKFDFTKTESFVERNVTYYYPELNSRVIAIQGNHDTGVEEFYRECAFTDGNTRFICFFASYVGLPAPEGQYKSTGKISDETIAFIENEMKNASADETIEHIILVCHWAISQESNFTWPIYDACPENGYSDNRQKLLDLAKEYGCDFYINGHEHNPNYPIGKAGTLYNINIGSTTSRWAVVEIHDRKIIFDIYSTAVANKETGEITTPVKFVKRVEQELTPKAVLTR